MKEKYQKRCPVNKLKLAKNSVSDNLDPDLKLNLDKFNPDISISITINEDENILEHKNFIIPTYLKESCKQQRFKFSD